MSMLDKNAILDCADPKVVADYLGIETKKIGSRTYIRCPSHLENTGKEDRNIGNCVLTKAGYKCYSCGAYGNTIDLVIAYTKSSFKDAMDIVAEIYGGPSCFTENNMKQRRRVLSASDLELIGLCSSNNVENSDNGRSIFNISAIKTEDKDDIGCVRRGDEYLLYKKTQTTTLQILFEKDPLAYYSLIERKAKEAVKKYESLLRDCGTRHGAKAQDIFLLFGDNGQISDEVFVQIRKALKEKKERAQELYENFGKMREKEYNKTLR